MRLIKLIEGEKASFREKKVYPLLIKAKGQKGSFSFYSTGGRSFKEEFAFLLRRRLFCAFERSREHLNTAQSESLDFSKRARGGGGEDVDCAKFFCFSSLDDDHYFGRGGDENDAEDETRWTTDD